MKKFNFIFLFFLQLAYVSAQNFYLPSQAEIQQLPEWAKKMYSGTAVITEVEVLYDEWYSQHPFEKNYHTQYYKRWTRFHRHNLDEQGNYQMGNTENFLSPIKKISSSSKKNNINTMSGQPWQLIGPMQAFDGQANTTGEQTNVYCIHQNENNSQVLYCGTEPGDIFKSTDGGGNWTCVSFDLNLGGIGAIASDPTDENIVFAGSNRFLVRSQDGGITWDTIINVVGFYPNEILINKSNPQIICVASDNGFYRSNDGGNSWNKLFNESCYDIKCRPGNNAIIYLLKDNPTLKICEFFSSSDTATTFTLQSNGWYSSADPARVNMGGRLAVSADDSLRVYAYLIGDSKANDFGYIGVYRSNDGGQNWTLPNGPAGGPYTSTHLNLAYGEPNWTYHQGFYNCAIMANPTNADEILIGGLNLWRSLNGGQTFTSIAGYVGGPLNMHVDLSLIHI